MRLLTTSFLRLFAMNLGRSFRNSPDKAFDDAVMQLSAVLVLPIGWMAAEIWALVPWLHHGPSSATSFFIVVVVIFVFPVQSWLDRRFATYGQRPEAADPYRSESERIKTVIGFLLSIVIFLCAMLY